MRADIIELHKYLAARVKLYIQQHKKQPTVEGISKLLSNTLYSRRFFPYYAFNVLAGISESGKGVVYGYDAVGSFDTVTSGAQGSGSQLVTPVLDNQFKGHNNRDPVLPKDVNEVEKTLKDVINSAAERDIYTGDQVEMVIISKQGVRRYKEPIRRD